ncbi:MAG: sel1 repeat family protein [Rhodobacteraceae bacterium]|nr:sel1 repeat family protein [Paracoccaceae bacterium]
MTVSLGNFTRVLFGIIFITVISMPAAYSEKLDRDTLQAAAESGDLEAQRILGEALLFGIEGIDQDKDSGLLLLEQSADGGNTAAKATLGKILLDGYYLAKDSRRGLLFLEEAAAAGSARAQVTLGNAFLWGLNVDTDLERAQSLLGQAAESGNIEALRVLGEQLIGGWVLDGDIQSGLPMLENAVAKGDAKAKVILGTFILDGTQLEQDQAHALELFEEAAQSGNGEGLERYGETLMWSKRDPVAAESYLRRAGELGRGSAWVALAKGAMYGYLGRNSRAKFDEFAQKAHDAGEGRVALLDAERQMWGIRMQASGPLTIVGLEKEAEVGNKAALEYLIGLVRNGNQLNIRKNIDQAYGYLDQFSTLLTPTEIVQYTLTIDAAKANTITAYRVLSEKLERQPELKSLWFGKELFAANPNFVIYHLQVGLKRKGIYTGKLNALATGLTLRALNQECMTLKDTSRCGRTPLHPDVIGALLAR